MATRIKRGTLGDVRCDGNTASPRTTRHVRGGPWRWLARRLARREAAALRRLAGVGGVPALISWDGDRLVRSFIPGAPLNEGPHPGPEYFREARRLLNRLHRRGVTHNDLAKEANWLRQPSGEPGIVDFQLAVYFRRRTRLFRLLAREDLRHLLKHKRCYLPDAMTARERAIVASPAWPARWWRRLAKPCYRFVTRRVLGWPERTDATERERAA